MDNQEMVQVQFGTERSRELGFTLAEPMTEMVTNYLGQWEEGPIEPQELADRMDGLLLAAEANCRATILMAANTMGCSPLELLQMSVDRLANSILAEITAPLEGETVQ